MKMVSVLTIVSIFDKEYGDHYHRNCNSGIYYAVGVTLLSPNYIICTFKKKYMSQRII
jgi:hypothetical protein